MIGIPRKLLPSSSALAAFDAVARLGSFSAAASELSLTQGAISRQVAGLEEQLGTRLFERNSRGVFLTSAGTAYAESVGPALRMIRQASLQAMTKTQANSLHLAILPMFGTRWLMPRIPRFVARYPHVTLNFATRIGQFDFERENIDAAIHIGQPDWPGAVSTFLMDEFVVPVCSPGFFARHKIEVPDDLVGLPLFHMASRPGAWDHWFGSLGLKPASGRGMWFEQFSNVSQACIAGLGIALMPQFMIRSELESGQLLIAVPHAVKSPSAYYIVAPHARMSHAPVAAFISWILEEVAREGPARPA